MADLFQDNGDRPVVDPNKNYLEELVGENKKFKTVEDLARGKAEADQFVELFKTRFDELRTDYTKLREENQSRARLEEVIERLNQQLTSGTQNQAATEETRPQFDPKQVEELITSRITQRERERREEENANLVMGKLRERYGNNFQNVLEQQMQELDLSKDEVNQIARTRPKLFFKALGLDQEQRQETFHAPPTSTRASDRFAPTTKKRDWTYYQEIKNKNLEEYLLPKTQVQMQKDLLELGEDAFYAGASRRT